MRTDVHSPSRIKPEDYEYVALGCQKVEDLGDALFMQEERKIFMAHQEKTKGKRSKHRHGGNCHICGAWCIYTVHFYHVPTNTYVRTGMDCAEKLDMGDVDAFRTFRKNVKDALKRVAGKGKAEALLDVEGIQEAWSIYSMDINDIMPKGLQEKREAVNEAMARYRFEDNVQIPKFELTHGERVFLAEEKAIDTIKSIVETIIKTGNLTEKQANYVKTLIKQYHEAEKIINEKAEKHSNAAECPIGKQVITGTIIALKWHENAYGSTLKMTVEDDKGFKVWGSVPSKLDDVEKGNRIEFTATLEQSDNDSKFGFFKRPSKAKKVS